MTSGATIGALADELAEVLLRGDPFGASFMAISGYDDAVPDLSPEYQRAWRGRLTDIIARCADCEADRGDTSSRVLLETVRDTAARELAAADSRVYEFSVTTFPLGGPSLMLLIASRTQVSDAESATAYLTRCGRIPAYLDQHAARLRAAARDGLMPVAPLVSDVIRQLQDHLSHPERDPMLAHRLPEGWAGAAAWREEVERVIRDQVRPAIGRYADLLTELLPRSRPPGQAGLLYVPGGVPAYASCVRNGTTLPFDPDELHRLGLEALAEIEDQIGELGRAALGTSDVDDIMVRFRKDPALTAPDGATAMTRAAAAIARAEERLPGMFPSPPPPLGAGGARPPRRARVGMLGCAAWRAVRLVVDSGLHARGWSRARAREFALAHSPMPEDFVDAEIDRYIALPGQALGYLVGQREILRLRDDARSRLGAAFDIRDFHSAVLDHGSLPLPVLGQVVADWPASAP